jgi:hypothetical protein
MSLAASFHLKSLVTLSLFLIIVVVIVTTTTTTTTTNMYQLT